MENNVIINTYDFFEDFFKKVDPMIMARAVFRVDVCNALRRLREDEGLTRDQVAERCGTTVKRIGEFEDGEIDPTLEEIFNYVHSLISNIDMSLVIQKREADYDDRHNALMVRARCYGEDEWLYGYVGGHKRDWILTKDLWYEVDPATVGRYTGQCDKRNVAIFEGDIVEDNKGKRGIVVYIEADGNFIVAYDGLQDCVEILPEHIVVGNIHTKTSS